MAGFNKVVRSYDEALAGLADNMFLMVGGFGLCGIPENLIAAIRASGAKDLTFISNNAGVDDFGLGLLLQTRQIKKMISSYVGENRLLEEQVIAGKLDVELIPQGTLAERIRAGGAGIGGFFTRTGVGTVVAEGKETRVIDGRGYVLEAPIHADYALIKALHGDRWGNLVYRKTARNFGPIMATAAKVTIAQVVDIVPLGELDPENIVTPGIFVQRLVKETA